MFSFVYLFAIVSIVPAPVYSSLKMKFVVVFLVSLYKKASSNPFSKAIEDIKVQLLKQLAEQRDI